MVSSAHHGPHLQTVSQISVFARYSVIAVMKMQAKILKTKEETSTICENVYEPRELFLLRETRIIQNDSYLHIVCTKSIESKGFSNSLEK